MTYNEVLRVVLAVMIEMQPTIRTVQDEEEYNYVWLEKLVTKIHIDLGRED